MHHTISIEPGLNFQAAFDKRQWSALLDTMLHAVNIFGTCIELNLVNDQTIARVNAEAMGCTGPTNILSFPSQYCDGADLASQCISWQNNIVCSDFSGNDVKSSTAVEPRFLGSLVLSLDTTAREAMLYGQDLRVHTIHLLAHGLAHILGYDHSVEMDQVAEIMEKSCINNMS